MNIDSKTTLSLAGVGFLCTLLIGAASGAAVVRSDIGYTADRVTELETSAAAHDVAIQAVKQMVLDNRQDLAVQNEWQRNVTQKLNRMIEQLDDLRNSRSP